MTDELRRDSESVAVPAWLQGSAKVYASAGMGRSIGVGRRPCVLVVDFQRAFTDPTTPLGLDVEDAVLNTVTLLATAREAGLPILYLAPIVEAEAGSSPLLTKVPTLAYLKPGTPGVEIDDRLAPHDGDVVVHKTAFSGFHRTDLEDILRRDGIDTVFVAGCVTSTCVRATVIDGVQRAFRMIVVAECVGDRTPELHQQHLFEMGVKFADVVHLDSVLDYLSRPGQHDVAGARAIEARP